MKFEDMKAQDSRTGFSSLLDIVNLENRIVESLTENISEKYFMINDFSLENKLSLNYKGLTFFLDNENLKEILEETISYVAYAHEKRKFIFLPIELFSEVKRAFNEGNKKLFEQIVSKNGIHNIKKSKQEFYKVLIKEERDIFEKEIQFKNKQEEVKKVVEKMKNATYKDAHIHLTNENLNYVLENIRILSNYSPTVYRKKKASHSRRKLLESGQYQADKHVFSEFKDYKKGLYLPLCNLLDKKRLSTNVKEYIFDNFIMFDKRIKEYVLPESVMIKDKSQ